MSDYQSPPAPARRSVATWVMLLAVWSIGLLFWTLYGIALVYLVSKIL